MKKFYTLFVFLFFAIAGYAQQAAPTQNYYVSKAWVNEAEEWAFYEYEGQIVVSTTPQEGSIKITNRNFLFDFVMERLNSRTRTVIPMQNSLIR